MRNIISYIKKGFYLFNKNRIIIILIFSFFSCSDNNDVKIIGEWQGLDDNEYFVKSNFFMRFNGEVYQTQIKGNPPESYSYIIKDNILLIDKEGWENDHTKWGKEFKIVNISDDIINIKIYNNDEFIDGVFSLMKTKDNVNINREDDFKYFLEK